MRLQMFEPSHTLTAVLSFSVPWEYIWSMFYSYETHELLRWILKFFKFPTFKSLKIELSCPLHHCCCSLSHNKWQASHKQPIFAWFDNLNFLWLVLSKSGKQQVSKYMIRYRKGKLGIETLLTPMQPTSLYIFLYSAACCFWNKNNSKLKPNYERCKRENSKNG